MEDVLKASLPRSKSRKKNNPIHLIGVSCIIFSISGFVTFAQIDAQTTASLPSLTAEINRADAVTPGARLKAHFNPVTGEFTTTSIAAEQTSAQSVFSANQRSLQTTNQTTNQPLEVIQAPNGAKYVRTPQSLFQPLVATKFSPATPPNVAHQHTKPQMDDFSYRGNTLDGQQN